MKKKQSECKISKSYSRANDWCYRIFGCLGIAVGFTISCSFTLTNEYGILAVLIGLGGVAFAVAHVPFILPVKIKKKFFLWMMEDVDK